MDNVNYYNQSELWKDNINNRELIRFQEIIRVVPRNISSLLDIGCGNGQLLKFLLQQLEIPNLFGIDISLTALKIAKNMAPNAIFLYASADKLPFEDKSFDIIIASEVLEHLPYKVYEQTLKEISRVSKKYILITVPNNEDLKRTYIRCPYCGCIFSRCRHLRSFNEDILKVLFKNYQFKVKILREIGPITRLYPKIILKIAIKLKILSLISHGHPVCPQCGWRPERRNHIYKEHRNNIKRKGIFFKFDFFKKFISKTTKPWLLCLYERNDG